MSGPSLKAWYYVLTSLGTLSSSYYFNFLFFLLRDRYGFGDRQNLGVAALHGLVYVFAAVYGGRFAERRGYHQSLLIGFGGIAVCIGASAAASTVGGVLVGVACYTAVLLFIWPALEALVVAGEPPSRVPDRVGVYNCTWSGSVAVSYFTGGPLYDALGAWAIFGVPAAIAGVAFGIALWLRKASWGVSRQYQSLPGAPPPARSSSAPSLRSGPHESSSSNARSHSGPQESRVTRTTFLRLAWLANPLAYVAIYTLIAVMPGLALRLGLTTTEAGIHGSLWFFGRLLAFVVLWHWTEWHYRFRWLVTGYVAMVASFVACLAASSLFQLAVGQIVFGLSVGLIYYSSLFYSMDVGSAQAEHGGWHEAMIGVGILGGPAVGALSLQVWPQAPAAGAMAVTGVLLSGLAAMVTMWRRQSRFR